jgi:hypothetical protein
VIGITRNSDRHQIGMSDRHRWNTHKHKAEGFAYRLLPSALKATHTTNWTMIICESGLWQTMPLAIVQAMKRLFALLVTGMMLLMPIHTLVAKGHSPARSSTSRKSTTPGSRDGTYAGGKGSSHKGGHYKNSNTGNRERNRKAGVPK